MSFTSASNEEWLSVFQSTLSLFADVAFAISKGKTVDAAGHGFSAGNNLITLGQKLHTMAKPMVDNPSGVFFMEPKHAPEKRLSSQPSYMPKTTLTQLRPLNLSGEWTEQTYVVKITHIPASGAICLTVPRADNKGWLQYYGGARQDTALSIELLASGTNSKGMPVIWHMQGNDDGLQTRVWTKETGNLSTVVFKRC